jgi:hypothetical protein
MTGLGAAAVATAYLGAGVFYVASDMLSPEWQETLFSPVAAIAILVGLVAWGPACCVATIRYARGLGWRPAVAYFTSDVLPSLTILVGTLAMAELMQ